MAYVFCSGVVLSAYTIVAPDSDGHRCIADAVSPGLSASLGDGMLGLVLVPDSEVVWRRIADLVYTYQGAHSYFIVLRFRMNMWIVRNYASSCNLPVMLGYSGAGLKPSLSLLARISGSTGSARTVVSMSLDALQICHLCAVEWERLPSHVGYKDWAQVQDEAP